MFKFSRRSTWRLLRSILAIVLCLSLIISYFYLKSRPSYALHRKLHESEVEQSQKWIKSTHSKSAKYVFFRQLQGAGFNNQAQEILLFHHLASITSRVYVYQPLVWRPRGPHSTVPLSAFLRGPIRDGISSVVFEQVCAGDDITHVELGRGVKYAHLWEHAKEVLGGDDRCVVVDDWIMNWNYLASPGIHSIWPSFQTYLANHFEWSEYVQDIVDRAHSTLHLRSKPSNTDGDPYISLHLRRGDFQDHCQSLAHTHTGFTTWATLPLLQAHISPPPLDPQNATSTLEHCYPSLARILSIIDTYARHRPHIRTLHVLHDGAWDHPLVYIQHYRLTAALTDAQRAREAGWSGGPMKRVTHSGMLPLRFWGGEADWGVAVDVELGRNAEVFVGNGYSSLSTQVVALRIGADRGDVRDVTLL